MITFQPLKSTPWAALAFITICRMVGTQWEKVTFSRFHSSTSSSGS